MTILLPDCRNFEAGPLTYQHHSLEPFDLSGLGLLFQENFDPI